MSPFTGRIEGDIVRLTGDVVRRFCNGMFTNNARDLSAGEGQRTAMLDDRGRLQGVLDLYCASDVEFIAALEGVTADEFERRYRMYMMLDEVECESLDWHILTVQGAPRPDALVIYGRDRCGMGGFDILGSSEELERIEAALSFPVLDPLDIDALRVRAGKPRWPIDMGPKQLPHEMGMRDDFLHFEKGCYLGQETINRVDVMGQVRRALAGIRIVGDTLPPQGAEVRDSAGKKLGVFTSPLATDDLGNIGLAVLKKPSETPGTQLVVADGARHWGATTSALPFS